MWIQKSSQFGNTIVNADRFEEITILDQPGGMGAVILRTGTSTEFLHRGSPQECTLVMSGIVAALGEGGAFYSVAALGL